MTRIQAKSLKRGDRIRVKASAPIDAGCLGTVICRMSNGIWIQIDGGGSYTIPHREIEFAPTKVQP